MKAGLARESAIQGGTKKICRPVSWMVLKNGIGMAPTWGDGGRFFVVVFRCVVLLYV